MDEKYDALFKAVTNLVYRLEQGVAEFREALEAVAAQSQIGESKSRIDADDVVKMMPNDLAELLYFDVADEIIKIKPKQYLGRENFAKIASIIREQLKGEYVSEGKDSYFKVSRTRTQL